MYTLGGLVVVGGRSFDVRRFAELAVKLRNALIVYKLEAATLIVSM